MWPMATCMCRCACRGTACPSSRSRTRSTASSSKRRGSISAEHGIGSLKIPFLHFSRSEAEIELMRAIKQAMDPKGILNPGKLFAGAAHH